MFVANRGWRPILLGTVQNAMGSMRASSVFLLLAVLGIASAQASDEQRRASLRAEALRVDELGKRINALRPQRRDGPIRAENIKDAEVRELQAVTAAYLPGSVVNIGPVVVGCPCEDGSGCTDQVWVLAHRDDKTSGLLLSKISNQWRIGPVQLWWREYEKLLVRKVGPDAEDKLKEQFPTCAATHVSK